MADDDTLAAIRTRRAAITREPWAFEPNIHGDPIVSQKGRPLFAVVAQCSTGPEDYGRSNAEFIANAPADIDTLLAVVDEQAAEIARLRQINTRLYCTVCDEPIMPFEDSVPDPEIETDDRWAHRDCMEAGE